MSVESFEMCQLIRRSHCDRKSIPNHECVGEVTIKRGEVCLACVLCGKGEEIPGWSFAIAEKCKSIFKAAGLSWDALSVESQRQAVVAYQKASSDEG